MPGRVTNRELKVIEGRFFLGFCSVTAALENAFEKAHFVFSEKGKKRPNAI